MSDKVPPVAYVVIVLLVVALMAVGCNNTGAQPAAVAGQPTAAPQTLATPEAARDFTLPTLDGESITLSDLKGGWVLLNFWATWCGPCVEEMPYLNELARERPLTVLGINFHEEAEPVQSFVDEYKISFPILMELDSVTEMVYGVRALPRTYLIAPNGMIARRIVGQIVPEDLNAWLDQQGVR